VKSFVCGSEFTQDGWEHIVAFVEENGGIEYSRDLCGRLADEAKGLISDLPECPAKTSLTVLADYVISRQK
jgi:geranylgeranyl pyrophosphate synthase